MVVVVCPSRLVSAALLHCSLHRQNTHYDACDPTELSSTSHHQKRLADRRVSLFFYPSTAKIVHPATEDNRPFTGRKASHSFYPRASTFCQFARPRQSSPLFASSEGTFPNVNISTITIVDRSLVRSGQHLLTGSDLIQRREVIILTRHGDSL